jgi:uncharacterized protein YdbL (DUF1318 family)
MNTSSVLKLLGITAALWAAQSACVTINVNFPEGAAQKASDDFVKELYRARERNGGSGEPSATPSAPAPSAFRGGHGFWIAQAHAADSFNIQSPKTTALREKMSKRLNELLTYKRNGSVGEDNLGLLVIRDKEQIKPLLLKKIQSLVAAENSDRVELYAEVARLNGLKPNTMQDLGRTFSHSFQGESPSGTWVQSDSGTWSRKN